MAPEPLLWRTKLALSALDQQDKDSIGVDMSCMTPYSQRMFIFPEYFWHVASKEYGALLPAAVFPAISGQSGLWLL